MKNKIFQNAEIIMFRKMDMLNKQHYLGRNSLSLLLLTFHTFYFKSKISMKISRPSITEETDYIKVMCSLSSLNKECNFCILK